MAEYAAMTKDQRAEVKDVGGYVGGRIESGNRKAGNISDRQLVCLDADFADESLWDVWDLMVGKAALMHSSHSSTPEQPRLRFVIPLARPVTAEEYEPIARKLAEWIGIDYFDDTTYEAERLMYWGSCPKDAEYICQSCDGDWVEPDEVLGAYDDWHNMAQWPTSSRQERVIAKMGKVQGDPLTKPGIVGAFCRVYSIPAAIETYLQGIYVPCGEGRWTYTGGSTTGGAATYDGDTFIYSHHDTDPCSRRLCNAFDLVRLHKFGSLDEGSTADLADLPSMAAMKALCGSDERVCAELATTVIKQDPDEVFKPEHGLQAFVGDITEQGLALAFSQQYGDCLKYSKSFGWMFWDGTRWVLDAEAEAGMLILHFTDDLYGQARLKMQIASTKEEQKLAAAEMSAAIKSRSAAGVNHLLALSRSMLYEPNPGRYDAAPWDLNTPDGIIDLKTGDVRAHRADACCTKCTMCTPSGTGAEKWLAFIDHITSGDKDFALYLQNLAGMAAVGKVYEEGLVISHGPGGNGKSTFFGAIGAVLGDYAKTLSADALVSTNGGHTDQTYIAALRGARLVVMGETEEGASMSTAQLKRVTSRDVISARALYKDPIEFTPTHTTIMHTNHLPRLSSLDGGTRRRIAVAPFPATLPPDKVISDYGDVLVQECGGAILRWIIEGAIRFYSNECKLKKPACVQQATERYTNSEDWLGTFMEDTCDVDESAECGGSDLYAAYQRWANANGLYAKRNRDFAEALEQRGFARVRRASGRVWIGLALKQSEVL